MKFLQALFFVGVVATSAIGLASIKKIPDLIRVGVIDTGLDITDPRFSYLLCSDAHHVDFSGTGLRDKNGHGTRIVETIKEYAGSEGYCLIIAKYTDFGSNDATPVIKSLVALLSQKVSLVNMSFGGQSSSNEEHNLIRTAHNVKFNVSAGNDCADLDSLSKLVFPAMYSLVSKNVTVVGALGLDGKRFPSSNYGSIVTSWELGESMVDGWAGTSMATAVRTGKDIVALVKKRKESVYATKAR